MPTPNPSELAELASTLETSKERLSSIQKDIGLISTLVGMAAVTLRHHPGAAGGDTELSDLVATHHKRLESIAGALHSARGSEASADQIRLEPADHSIRIGQQRLALTESEYRVLELLMGKRPEPASRRDLLNHLYAGDEEPTHAVLDMFIYRIRQKLKKVGLPVNIRSVRGSGWLLELPGATPVNDGAQQMQASNVG